MNSSSADLFKLSTLRSIQLRILRALWTPREKQRAEVNLANYRHFSQFLAKKYRLSGTCFLLNVRYTRTLLRLELNVCGLGFELELRGFLLGRSGLVYITA